ncbi:MAG: NUDIX domain-containing protein [Candidatus Pacebacteria bacterium]|nr:NUDIX domain-containing protein [Candidatus Paceibacterota bacterium]MBP9840229.1 NUDIX domain-containing protein [Candidatus Paceibacterota bacterium]
MTDTLRFAIVAVDTALFTIRDGALFVRLIKVERPPHFPNTRGLPGGLLAPKETAEESAIRHLMEKAGVDARKVYHEQLYTFSEVDRDPRGRVVAVAYLALVPWDSLSSEEQMDANGASWVPVARLKGLAYDHDEILRTAIARLASRATYTTLVGKLMPVEFTLTELEKAYEAILGTSLDKRNFRKKILKIGVLKALGKKRAGGRFRPAELYRFAKKNVEEIEVL